MTAGLSRTTVLTVVTAIEIAVLLFFFVGRWYSRKYGWRKVFRRSWHYLRDTVTDLAGPGCSCTASAARCARSCPSS